MPASTEQAKHAVLVIDDSEDSRYLIRRALRDGDYEVVEAASGREGLALARRMRPDVVLLDVCMPGMGGFEVCRVLRAEAATARTPVMFLSVVFDQHAITQAFAAGGVDFLAKPFRPEELRARVAVHAELGRARRELEASHERLAALNHEKDVMFGVAAHDLRGPLAVISGFVENALSRVAETDERVVRQALEVTLREVRQMEHFLGGLLDLNALERGAPGLRVRPISLVDEARAAVERASPGAARKAIELRLVEPEERPPVMADALGLRRILDNLISNALKFTPAGGRVRVRFVAEPDEVECLVCDDGPGLTSEDMTRVFGRFARLSARPTGGEKSTGLGLAICRALVEGMGGRIRCGNNPEGGAYFAFVLPLPAGAAEGRGQTRSPFGRVESESPFPYLLAKTREGA